MAYDGSLIFDTKVDASGLVKDLGKLGSVAKKSIGVVTTAVSAAGTALAGLGGAAINAGITFESAFAGVKKTVDATDAEISALREGILDLAGEMPMTADAIAGIAESAGQLGIQNENILGFTKTMADLGVATNLAGEEAASTLAKFANITDMDQSNFDRLGSTIVALGNSLATTEADIAAMAMRLAGTGKQIGLSEAQILSFAGALSSVGIEAEAGGTAFSKVFKDMQLAVETGNADLANFAKVAGMSAAQFKTAFQTDAAGAILAFIDGLGKSEERGMSVVKVLDDLGITEVRMSDALSRASGASSLFADALSKGTDAWEENTALTKEAEQRYATMESRIAILRNKVTELGVTFYESTNTDVGGAVDLLSEYVGEIQTAFEGNGLAGAVGALGDIIGDLAVRIAEAAPDILSAGAVLIEKLADSLTENADAVGAAAAEIAVLLVKTIQKFIPKIVDLAGEILKGFAKGLGDALPILKPFTSALELIGNNLKTLTTITVAYIAANKIASVFKAMHESANSAAKAIAAKTAANVALQAAETRGITISALKLKYDYMEVANLSTAQIATSLLTGKTTMLTAAKALCTKAQLALNAAWNANPVGLVVTAVAALAAGIAVLSSACNKETEEQKALRVEMEADIETLQKNTEAIRESINAYETRAASVQEGAEADVALLSRTEELAEELSTLADENGAVSDSERARAEFILGELNSALGTEYTMTGNIISQYDELIAKIRETIKAKQAQIIADSYLENYKAALQAQTEAEANATESARFLAEKRKEITDAVNEAREAVAKYHSAEAAAAMSDKDVLEFATSMNFQLSDSTKVVAEGYDALTGEMAKAQAEVEAFAGLSQTTAEAEAKYSTASMEIQLKNYDAVVAGHGRSAEEMRILAEGSGHERVAEIIKTCAEMQEAETNMQNAATDAEKQMWQTKIDDARTYGQALVTAYEKTGGNAEETIARELSGMGETGQKWAAVMLAAINGAPVDFSVLKTSIETEQKSIENLGDDFAAGYALKICSSTSIQTVQQAAYALVRAALSAIQERQDSNSPAKESGYLGEDFVAGYENALVEGAASVAEAAGGLANSALEAVKRHMPEGMDFALDSAEWEISKEGKHALAELKLHREIGLITEKEYYEKLEYWRNGYLKKGTQDWWDYTIEIAEGFEKLSEEDKKRLSEAAKKEKAALKDRLDLGLISETEYYAGLEKIRDAYFAEGSDEWLSYTKEIAKYQKEAVEAQKKEIVSLFTEAAEEAGKSVDEVLKLQESMEKKLRSFTASPYDAKTVRLRGVGENGEDVEYSVNSLHDYAADNAALSAYRDAIIAVKERGVPPEFLDMLRDMSVEEGTTFAKLLTEASDEEFDSYLTSWQENRDLTKEIAQDLYRDEATTAAQTLTAALEAAGKEVPEGFFDNGKTAAENFGEGFIEKISTVVTKIKSAFSSQMQGILPKITYSGGVPVYGGSTNNFNSVVNISAVSPAQQNMLAKGTKIAQTLGGNT